MIALEDIEFSDPAWLGALWGLPAIILLYLLRRRTARVLVPHLPIWEGVLERMRRRVRWTRTLLSILLQMAIFGAAILMLAGPYTVTEAEGAGHTIIVVDRSLGVRALDANGSPLADAVMTRARQLVTDGAGSGSASVAFFQDGVQARAVASRDSGPLLAALEDPGVPRGVRDWEALLLLRDAVGAESRIAMITPFDPGEAMGQRLRDAQVTLIKAGAPHAQAGITEVLRSGDGVDVTVAGSGPTRTLALRRGEAAISTVEVEVGARVHVPIPADAGARPALRLEPMDGFPADDLVPLSLPERQRIRVLVVADRTTPWLDGWLNASEIIDVAGSNRTRSTRFRDWVQDYDVTILVDDYQELPLPPGRYLLLGAGAPDLPVVRDTRVARESEPLEIRREDPLVRALDLSRWRIERVAATRALAGLDVVVKGSTGPLVSRGRTQDIVFVDIAVSPDPEVSTLPLLAAFPLVLEAAVVELAALDARGGPPVYEAGQGFTLNPGEEPVLTTPEGASLPPLRPLPDGTGYQLPDRPGRYDVGLSDDPRRIAVALLGYPGVPGRPLSQGASLPGFPEERSRRSLRWWLLWVLFVAVGLEWWLWNLRVTD